MLLDRRELLISALIAAGAGALEMEAIAAVPQIGGRKKKRTVDPIPRYGHATALLSSGNVLVIGGHGDSGALASCQIYDPYADAWYDAAPLSLARGQHSATRLPDGRIAVLGGFGHGALSLASTYDHVTDKWTPARPLALARYSHTAQALKDGRVVVTGGFNLGLLADAEVWSE